MSHTPDEALADAVNLREPPETDETEERLNCLASEHSDLRYKIDYWYSRRDTDPEALDNSIEACEEQIALAGRVTQQYRRKGLSLPAHRGFTQLAIIRERQGDYGEAIRLSRLAQFQGWRGDWERRIARCVKKLEKS